MAKTSAISSEDGSVCKTSIIYLEQDLVEIGKQI